MNILGISAFYHDSAAALICDGEIKSAAQEERFSRIKHDSAFPRQAIKFCLDDNDLGISDIDYIVFYEKPFQKFDRLLHSYLQYAPAGLFSFLKSMPVWLKQKLWIKDSIARELGFEGSILFPEHHESHAASAFFPSPFEEAAFLTMDGVGEWTTTSFGTGAGNKVNIHSELHFPHSLGLLYSAFTYFCGFRVNSGEYKLMGLAPYGKPVYADLIREKLIDLKSDGSFRMNMDYFGYGSGLRMTRPEFAELFGGPPRKPESEITRREMDLARSIQDVTEEIILKMAHHVFKQTGMKNLVLAGGVALNCVGNGRLLREGPFENIWIQPAAGDAGGALGAALFTWYTYLGNKRSADNVHDSQKASVLGPSFSEEDLKSFCSQKNIQYHYYPNEDICNAAADFLAKGKVIGWFQDRMEFGPRALGSRSIIGDARSPRMQSIMNLKIKFRESFRPFAPSVLAEKADLYFDMDVASPYMLLTAPVHENLRKTPGAGRSGIDTVNDVRSVIPAVTHVDYSARIQTVSSDDHPRYYRMIELVYEKTGCPVIINTSFNVRGEPIVCTPDEAFRCFMRTDMDVLIMGRFLMKKSEQIPLPQDEDWRKQYVLD